GIGEALAKELVSRKAKIVIAARSLNKLEKLADDLKNHGTEILAVKTDVSDEKECKALIENTVEKFGKIDILINNAGISMRALFEQVELGVMKQLMDVNFWGMVYCTKYALPYLLKQKGSVVGVSSIAGFKGLPGRIGYSSSKFAMHGFIEVLRTENLKKDLHVLLACPGFTSTNIRKTALAKDGSQQGETPRDEAGMMSSEEVAKKIANAIEKKKRTLVLTAQGKLIVFLNKFIPAWVDKQTYNHLAKEPDSPFN
ncbi:SDR family oxidoreductase, partial [Bacteroidota bacterium]